MILCHLAAHRNKDSDAGKDGGQEEKGVREDEMFGWKHWINGHGFEQTLRDGEGQGGLACCSPWRGRVGHDWATEQKQERRGGEFPSGLVVSIQCFHCPAGPSPSLVGGLRSHKVVRHSQKKKKKLNKEQKDGEIHSRSLICFSTAICVSYKNKLKLMRLNLNVLFTHGQL